MERNASIDRFLITNDNDRLFSVYFEEYVQTKTTKSFRCMIRCDMRFNDCIHRFDQTAQSAVKCLVDKFTHRRKENEVTLILII